MTDQEREERISAIVSEHMMDGDALFGLNLLAVEKGLAEPTALVWRVGMPEWLGELGRLCRDRRERPVYLDGWKVTTR